jgi:transposase
VKPPRKAFFHKLDPQKVQDFVEKNPDFTCEQVGLHFGASAVAVYKCLKKLGFSFKKRSFSMQNETKNNE